MSATLRLTRRYGTFFVGCTQFATAPYTNTFCAIAGDDYGSTQGSMIAAGVVCGLLTFTVPILPVATVFTATLAAIAVSLAVASMFIAYPLAVLSDSLDTPWQDKPGVEIYQF